MTTKEKKEYAILSVLLIATFAVIYFNFLKPKPAPVVHVLNVPGPAGAPSAGTVPGGSGTASLPGAAPATAPSAAPTGMVAAGSSGGFLPNGTELHTDVLKSKPFSTFIEPTYPAVTKEEVGSDNLFGN